MVTEYEWSIIKEAMNEYQSVCEWSSSDSSLKDIKRVNKRIEKAVDNFNKLSDISTIEDKSKKEII